MSVALPLSEFSVEALVDELRKRDGVDIVVCRKNDLYMITQNGIKVMGNDRPATILRITEEKE